MGFFKLNVKKMAKNKDIKGLASALLDRKDLDVRYDAAHALDEMKDIDKIADAQFAEMLIKARYDSFQPLPKLDPKLQAKLRSSDNYVRVVVNSLLNRMGNAVLEPLVKAITGDLENLDYSQKTEIRGSYPFVIKNKHDALSPAMIDQLLSALNSPDETVVRSSAFVLGCVKKDHVTDALIGLLNKQDTFRYSEVAAALEEINDPRAIEHLLSAVQRGASAPGFAKALVNLGGHSVVEPLLNVVKSYIGRDDNYKQPSSTIEYISLLNDKRAIEPFIAFLSHQSNYETYSEYTRSALARALGDIGDGSVVQVLLRTLNTDPHDLVRFSAAFALGKLAERGQLGFMVEIARIGLEASVIVGSDDVKNAALDSLAKFPKK